MEARSGESDREAVVVPRELLSCRQPQTLEAAAAAGAASEEERHANVMCDYLLVLLPC